MYPVVDESQNRKQYGPQWRRLAPHVPCLKAERKGRRASRPRTKKRISGSCSTSSETSSSGRRTRTRSNGNLRRRKLRNALPEKGTTRMRLARL